MILVMISQARLDQHACAECSALHGTTAKPPHAGCTSPHGCRCTGLALAPHLVKVAPEQLEEMVGFLRGVLERAAVAGQGIEIEGMRDFYEDEPVGDIKQFKAGNGLTLTIKIAGGAR